MTAGIRWTYDRQAVVRISKQGDTTDWLTRCAKAAMRMAQADAPRRTGRYARSFVVGSEPGQAWYGNEAPYALDVEYGAGPTPPYRPLTRAARALGASLEGIR